MGCDSCIANCSTCICGNSSALAIPSSIYLEKSNTSYYHYEQTNSIVVPNPTTGETVVKLNYNENGIITLIITDMRGNQIYTTTMNKESNEISLKFNTQEFSNGVYNYLILLDGNKISSGTFIRSN